MKKQNFIIVGLLVLLFAGSGCKKDIEAENIYNIVGKWVYYKTGDIDGPLELYKHSPGCAKDFIEFGKASGSNIPFWEEYLFDSQCTVSDHNKLGKGISGTWIISNVNILTTRYGFLNSLGYYKDKYGNFLRADPDYYEIVELNKKTLRLNRMGQGKIQVLIFQKM